MSDLVARLRERARLDGWPRAEEYNEAADKTDLHRPAEDE